MLVALSAPLLLVVLAVVVDSARLFVAKRHAQNAVDAAALAASAHLPAAGACLGPDTTPGTCLYRVRTTAEKYSSYNGGPAALHACDVADSDDTNCYLTPYSDNPGLVQVRVRMHVTTLLAGAVGLGSFTHVSARAAASAKPVTGTTVTPGVTTPGAFVPPTTVFTTTVSGSSGSVAFAMSTACPAITYSGAGGGTIGALQTNGGVAIQGSDLSVEYLGWGKRGTPGCDPKKGVIGRSEGPFDPKAWLVPPPDPAPPPGCTVLEKSSFTLAGHPPGVYCLIRGTLKLSSNGTDFSGYTFFAPSISVSSNGQTFAPAAGETTVFDAYDGDLDLSGQGNTISGNMFAPNGKVSVSGGALGAGSGFIESLTLAISGNFASFTGTGPPVPGTTTTVPVTTIPATTAPGTTSPGSTQTVTTGTTHALHE